MIDVSSLRRLPQQRFLNPLAPKGLGYDMLWYGDCDISRVTRWGRVRFEGGVPFCDKWRGILKAWHRTGVRHVNCEITWIMWRKMDYILELACNLVMLGAERAEAHIFSINYCTSTANVLQSQCYSWSTAQHTLVTLSGDSHLDNAKNIMLSAELRSATEETDSR